MGRLDWAWLLGGLVSEDLPVFCLERWQSLHETRVELNLAESGVEPPGWDELASLLGADPLELLRGVDLGYGWTMGWPPLRERIAEGVYHGSIDSGSVLVTAGGAEANMLTVLGLVAPGDTVLVDMPSYMQVRGLLEARGARITEVWRGEDWRLPLDRVAELVEALRPRAVFINNPNNPTGRVERSLEPVLEAAARTGTVVVVDEVYRELVLDGDPPPSVVEEAVGAGAVAVSTGSVSKAYGLPGARIGWVASNEPRLVEKLWAVKDYTTISPCRLGEAVAAAALEPGARERLLSRARRIVSRNLGLLESLLDGLLEVSRPGAGAFAWARLQGSGTAATVVLAERLLERSVLVVPGECFRVGGWLRIGLGVADEARAARAYRRLAELLRVEVGEK